MSKSNCNICEGLIWNKNQVVFKTYYQLYDENPLGSERQSSKIYEIGYGFFKIKKAYICHPCHDFIMADYPNFNCTKAYPKYRKPNFGPGVASVLSNEYVSSNIVKILEDKDMIIKMAEKFILKRKDELNRNKEEKITKKEVREKRAAGKKEKQKEKDLKRQKEIKGKYDSKIARRILAKNPKPWIGMTDEMLRDMLGKAAKIQTTEFKDVIKEKWFFGKRKTIRGTIAYKTEYRFENGELVGIKELE